MKTICKTVFIFFIITTLFSFGQDNTKQEIKKPSEGKSIVYITRSEFGAFALNFRIYDERRFLGAVPTSNYIVYECEPGEHIFWAASENRDFVHATLGANKTYVIDLEPRIGAFIAAVGLVPFDSSIKQHKKSFWRVIKNHKEMEIADITKSEEKKDNIDEAMEKYKELKEKNSKKIQYLLPTMNFENANKP